MSLRYWFLPDKDTHHKAHLISWEGLVIYILIFILLQVGFSVVGFIQPGILGITSSVDQKKLIELSNQERQKMGLSQLSENEALDKAAAAKAASMFSENYWSHFAPSGKTPWDFILGSGYKFTFAGENLAKNFYNSEDVVSAWMVSKTHRENLLNAKYQDTGIAVVEGVLNGQETTLVVQMFGTSQVATQPIAQPQPTQQSPPTVEVKQAQQANAQPKVVVSGKRIEVPKKDLQKPLLIASTRQDWQVSKPLVDPYLVYKTAGFSLILLMTALLALDLIVLRRRGVLRITSHHYAHMAILSVAAASLINSSPGSIL